MFHKQSSGSQYLESEIQRVVSRIQDCLGPISLGGSSVMSLLLYTCLISEVNKVWLWSHMFQRMSKNMMCPSRVTHLTSHNASDEWSHLSRQGCRTTRYITNSATKKILWIKQSIVVINSEVIIYSRGKIPENYIFTAHARKSEYQSTSLPAYGILTLGKFCL